MCKVSKSSDVWVVCTRPQACFVYVTQLAIKFPAAHLGPMLAGNPHQREVLLDAGVTILKVDLSLDLSAIRWLPAIIAVLPG